LANQPIQKTVHNSQYLNFDTQHGNQGGENVTIEEYSSSILADVSFEGILVHCGGAIIDANHTLANMTGYELAELIGKDGIVLLFSESQDLVNKNNLLTSENSLQGVVVRKDGSNFVFELQ
jgi:PAS domain S-box-containing protein